MDASETFVEKAIALSWHARSFRSRFGHPESVDEGRTPPEVAKQAPAIYKG